MGNVEDLYRPPQVSYEPRRRDTRVRLSDNYACILIRIAARGVDFTAEVIANFIAGAIALRFHRASTSELTFATFAFGVIIPIVHQVVATSIGGASIGKVIFGLRVRKTTLAPCGVVPAFGREVGLFFDLFFFGVPGFSTMRRSPRRQRIGDKLAGTVVIRARDAEIDRALIGAAVGLACAIVGFACRWLF